MKKLIFLFICSDADKISTLELPEQWLWDIIDEYIYQFQNFHMSKLKNKKTQDFQDLLSNRPDVWSVTTLLANLYKLAEKRNNNEKENEVFTNSQTFSALSYFSVIGLLRVHCLLGDFTLALQTLEGIDLSRKV